MADEPEEVVEDVLEPAEEVETEQPAEGEAPTEAEKPAEQPVEDETKRVPWFQKRINELTAARRAEEAAKKQLIQENEALKALLNPASKPEGTPQTAEQPKPATPAPQDFEKAVEERAAAILRQQELNRQSNEVYQKGVAAFPGKFDAALQNLQAAGVYSNEDMGFVEAALATEAPELVLYDLGNRPEEAMRLASLSQTQRAIALDRLARDLKSPPVRVSAAPTPVTPVTGARVNRPFDPADMKTPTEKWMEERNKQVAARRAQQAGR